MDAPILTLQDLVNLRRSLAMGSLPPREVAHLVDTCDTLLREVDEGQRREAAVRQELDALRPVVADLRTRLSKLHARVGGTPGASTAPAGRGTLPA